MRIYTVSADFPLNRRMRKDILRGKLCIIRADEAAVSGAGGSVRRKPSNNSAASEQESYIAIVRREVPVILKKGGNMSPMRLAQEITRKHGGEVQPWQTAVKYFFRHEADKYAIYPKRLNKKSTGEYHFRPRPKEDTPFGQAVCFAVDIIRESGPGGIKPPDLTRKIVRKLRERDDAGQQNLVTSAKTAMARISKENKEFGIRHTGYTGYRMEDAVPPGRAPADAPIVKTARKDAPKAGANDRARPNRAGLTVAKRKIPANVKEQGLYNPFVEWIGGVEKGCKAVVLGNKGKKPGHNLWTPDVVAVLKPSPSIQSLNFPPEVISVEMKAKAEQREVMAGFGQACAYKVFSHKSYLVVPEDAKDENQERLLPLCDIFGIGLVLFTWKKDGPDFNIHARASSHQPSLLHVEKFLTELGDEVRDNLGIEKRFH